MINESEDNMINPVEDSIFDNSQPIDSTYKQESTEIKEINSFLEKLEDKLKNQLFDQFEQIYNDVVKLYSIDSQGKANTLYQIALLTSKYTNIQFSLKYWQNAINIYEKLNDDYSKALIIHNMATTMVSNGDTESAKKFWYESILIKERINDTLGIAATLCNLAWLAHSDEDFEQEATLYLKAVDLLVNNQAWSELVNVLIKLSQIDIKKSNYYLAQALFIAIYIYISPKIVFSIVSHIIKNIGFEHEFSPVISSACIILTWSDEISDEAIEIQSVSKEVMIACAISRNIKEDNIGDWIIENNLNNSEFIFDKLKTALIEISQNEPWFFDPQNLNNL